MDQAQLQQLSAALEQLLELPTEEREQAVAQMDDPVLQRAVRRALGRLDRVGPLDRDLFADWGGTHELPSGTLLGRWRVRSPLGEGGMARVYLAERSDGPAQQVAIKLIRRELVSPRLRERFLREQQVVARLEHPGIARMVDAGVTDEGEPWLATEYVAGQSLLIYCAQRQLDVEARLRLFLRLLAAVQHAHQHLVVHRDIKPSNILVSGDGGPKLLDFGIARVLDDDPSAQHTQTEFRVLTPDYAAPEQFTGGAISTATDLYALGVVLYELLTGVRPRRPSAHDGSVSVTAPSQAILPNATTASLRRRLRAQLRGDLDAIVLKALRETPTERYASAEAFARDLQAYLDGRPVQARRGDRLYRLRKFARRNRFAVAASALFVLALAAGVAATLWQAAKAREQAARAQAAAEETRAQLDYLDSLLRVLAPSTDQARELDRGQLIAEATRRARRELAGRPRLLASVELSLGGVAEEVGAYRQAVDLFDRAYERRRAVFGSDSVEAAQALAASGSIRERVDGQLDESQRRLRDAASVLRRRAPGSLPLVVALHKWAIVLGNQDEYPQAEALLTEAARICDSGAVRGEECERVWIVQASMYGRLQRDPDAITAYERALASRRARLGEEHADTVFILANLGRKYFDHGQRARGRAMLENAYALQKRIYTAPTSETLATLGHLATVLAADDQNPRALALRSEHLAQVRQMFGEQHADVALSYANLGSLLFAEGRFAEAAQAQTKARGIYAVYAGKDGAATLIVQSNLAEALQEDGRAQTALPLARDALAGIEKLFGADSPHLAARLSTLARVEADLGSIDAALDHFDRSIALYRKHKPDDIHADAVNAARAKALLDAGRRREAETGLRVAVQRIDSSARRTQRAYWEAFAYLVEAACANGAADCRSLRDKARAALASALPGIARKRIEAALQATSAG